MGTHPVFRREVWITLLIGRLKEKVEKTKSKSEAKAVIEEAGMRLTDSELDNVTGGGGANESWVEYDNEPLYKDIPLPTSILFPKKVKGSAAIILENEACMH